MIDLERKQFRVLYRSFLRNVIDLDVVSAGGDTQSLLSQLAAVLIAFNFVVALMIVPRYFTSGLAKTVLRTNAWADEEFLISTTMSIVGVLMVLAWDALIPDLRDALILDVLPVKTRVIFLAKLAALGTMIGGAMVLANVFTGAGFPITSAGSNEFLVLVRCFVAYWITMMLASIFVACAILTFQGLAMQLLSYRRFLSLSSYAQLSAIFAIVSLYILKPPLATPHGLTAPQNQRWLEWLPSYWFLGIFQELNGSMHSVFRWLALRGVWALIVAVGGAVGIYAFAYRRNFRRMLEQPEIAPGKNRFRLVGSLPTVLATVFRWGPVDRAIVTFVARTLARSRKHRLFMGFYCGIGLAIALVYTVNLIPGDATTRWTDPSSALSISSFVILFFAILGARIVFTLPFALRSNWIFRTTAIETSVAYFQSVRRSLYAVIAVPVWSALAVFFFIAWPVRLATQHVVILALLGTLIVERSLQGFRKIPFTCSYLPGRANLKVTLGMYGGVILFLAYVGGEIEFWLLHGRTGYVVMLSVLTLCAAWAWHKRQSFSSSADTPVQFEDLPLGNLELLDLEREGDMLGAQP